MTQVASARVEENRSPRVTDFPDADRALVVVASRLLAIAADTSVNLTPSGRADAERVAVEMLAQAGERSK